MATVTSHSLFYTEQLSTPLRIAQVIGLTSTAFLAAPAPLLARQWKTQFSQDKLLAPGIVLVSSSVFGFLAYRSPGISLATILYTSATTVLVATTAYSLVFLEPINQKLEQKADALASTAITDTAAEAEVKKEETVHVLVDRWATVNLGRTLLSGVAAVLAMWAALDKVDAVEAGLKVASGADRMG
nr:hypothetical protein CFP56_65181 [Quercus suber]